MVERPPVFDHDLLCDLPSDARRYLEPHVTAVTFARGDILFEPDEIIDRVWFIDRGLVALLTRVDDQFVDGLCVGRGGALGLAVCLGDRRAIGRGVVQMDGRAWTLPAEMLQGAMKAEPTWCARLMRYTEAVLAMVVQVMACNAVHAIEQRYCRLLLTWRDQADGHLVPLTQDFAARSLGLDRTSLAPISRRLQEEGAIVVRHGRIAIEKPEAVLARSCGCYALARRRFAALRSGRD